MTAAAVPAEKPYGYRVEIYLHGHEYIERHFTGTEATVRRKAMLVARAQRILAMEPFTHAQWIRTYGDPTIRH